MQDLATYSNLDSTRTQGVMCHIVIGVNSMWFISHAGRGVLPSTQELDQHGGFAVVAPTIYSTK